ncbi:hypothetical protein LEN26_019970 [Aphanomyces euteiches]|nr:hypothetical protein LEN26_019970 [Aphanomyces euteiches]KAH9103914.1 hypothetical protein AeMF1_019859 [Aphanomyces euteiches]
MSSERTPLFHAGDSQDNSRSKKALLFAVGTVGALATVGYYHHATPALNAVEMPAVASLDEEPPVTISSSTPGSCKRTSDCAKYGDGYSCVALESNLVGLTLLSQCVKGDVCTGNVNGACPTFNSWSTKFRQIQPVCAFAEVKNCDNALSADGTSVNPADANKTVTCYAATFKNAKGDTKDVNGIYKCVDAKLYAANKMGFLDLTPVQLLACAGNTTTDSNGITHASQLCNSHGTCGPVSQYNSTYGCKCNAGYSSADNCYAPVGNVCDGFGQCGSMGSCDPKNGQCICKAGAKGDQCAKCDVSAAPESVCSGQGKCGVDGTCQCPAGLEGNHCEIRTKANNSATSSSNTTDSSPSSSAVSLSVSTVASLALLALSFVM